MGDEQTNTQFRKQKNTQNLNEKSRIFENSKSRGNFVGFPDFLFLQHLEIY